MAPIVGSAIYELLDYRSTTDVMMAACFGWSLIYFIFNVGFKIFKEEKANHDKIKAGQEALLLSKDDYEAEITVDEGSPKVQVI